VTYHEFKEAFHSDVWPRVDGAHIQAIKSVGKGTAKQEKGVVSDDAEIPDAEDEDDCGVCVPVEMMTDRDVHEVSSADLTRHIQENNSTPEEASDSRDMCFNRDDLSVIFSEEEWRPSEQIRGETGSLLSPQLDAIPTPDLSPDLSSFSSVVENEKEDRYVEGPWSRTNSARH